MSKFLHKYNDDAKAITIPRVFFENSRAKNRGSSVMVPKHCISQKCIV